jgi:hypothetical protein
MAIYCMQCGKELPNDARFCLNCGKPVKDVPSSNIQQESRWEYCEIVCKVAGFLGLKSYFVAQAASSRGRYAALRSANLFEAQNVFRVSKGGATGDVPNTGSRKQEEKARIALDEIMSKLFVDGWQLTGQKGDWWELAYRRLEHS